MRNESSNLKTFSSNIAEDGDQDKKQTFARRNNTPSLVRPAGVLAVHIKHCKLTTLDFEDLFSKSAVSVYIRIHACDQTKCSTVYENVSVLQPRVLAFDDLRHLQIELSNIRRDSSNYLIMEIVAFEKPECHIIVSSLKLHFYDILKRLFIVETMDFKRKEKSFAEVEVEMCFSYGMFGYGYSNQLENRQKLPQDYISHSVLFRPEAPLDRLQDQNAPDVMTCLPVSYPKFINFAQKVDIGSTAREFDSELHFHHMTAADTPVLLISRIRKRMHKLQKGYNSQGSRIDRMKYLNDLVNPEKDPKTEEEKEHFTPGKNVKLKYRKAAATQPAEGERGSRAGKLSVPLAIGDLEQEENVIFQDMVPVLTAAPGITARIPSAKSRPVSAKVSTLGDIKVLRERAAEMDHTTTRDDGVEESKTETSRFSFSVSEATQRFRNMFTKKTTTSFQIPRMMVTPPTPTVSEEEFNM